MALKYEQHAPGENYWIFPEGGEVYKNELYVHADILEPAGFGSHACAFKRGFLRVTVAFSELNLQWGGTLTPFQRRRATELLQGIERVEISSASRKIDPEGQRYNLTLECADSRFRRRFAAALRHSLDLWD